MVVSYAIGMITYQSNVDWRVIKDDPPSEQGNLIHRRPSHSYLPVPGVELTQSEEQSRRPVNLAT